MTGREGDNLVAHGRQAFHLRGKVDGSRRLAGPALVEGHDADGISGRDESVLGLVVEDPGEDTIEPIGYVDVMFEVLTVSVFVCIRVPMDVPAG